jgi:hypothetical protein
VEIVTTGEHEFEEISRRRFSCRRRSRTRH